MPNRGIAGQIVEVRSTGVELHLDCRIPGFLDLPCGEHDSYESPTFGFYAARWNLKVWPKRGASGEVSLSLYRQVDDGPSTRRGIYSWGVRGSGGGVESRREEEERGFVKSYAWSLNKLCKRSDLSEQKERMMPGDALTVVCEMKVSGTTARGMQKLSEDFGTLLTSGDKSDVTVQVGEQEFQVHSLVLFVRCPALSISLRHESAERASNRIVVEECEPDNFRDFLHFLYTGYVQSLTKDNVFALYRIADRYLVDDLKRLCLELVQNAMSVDTFCDAVRLAMTHGESGLMERANAFATENIWSILHSEEWQNFTLECPAEANEVLLNLGPHPKRQKSKPWKKIFTFY